MPQTNNIAVETTSATTFARELKVRTLQNKFTVFIVALALFVFWPYIMSSRQGYQTAQAAQQETKAAYQKKVFEQKEVLADLQMLKDVSSDGQRQALIQCYNSRCTSLPVALQKEPVKSAFKSFLQLQQATADTKFVIDQKKLLAYVNEFLVRSADGAKVGEIIGLSLGSPEPTAPVVAGVVSIPVNVTIIFPNKQSLLGFLRNTEQLVSPTFPMLSVVNSVTYDVVKSDESQEVSISLTTYMLQP